MEFLIPLLNFDSRLRLITASPNTGEAVLPDIRLDRVGLLEVPRSEDEEKG